MLPSYGCGTPWYGQKDEKYEVIHPTLGMNKRNFDKHVNSLFSKLGVHKRSGATRLWELFGKRVRGGIQCGGRGTQDLPASSA